MFPLDREILLVVNGAAGQSGALFEVLLFLCGEAPLVACVACMLALWWTDVEGGDRGGLGLHGFAATTPGIRASRRRCVALALGVTTAFVCTRLIAFANDVPRPIGRETLVVPIDSARFGELARGMTGFGAFPSDHAALYFALAAGLFAWSRRLGSIGLCAAAVVSMARVAVGFHYPLDMLAGGCIGAGIGWAWLKLARHSPGFFDVVVRAFDDHPAVLYPALFVVSIDFTAHFRFLFRGVFYLVFRLLGGGALGRP
jgi:undecaprenyl-diphosphatase